MNSKFILRIIILSFFFACNEKENTSISNPFTGELNLEYKLNIDSNSGENLESVTDKAHFHPTVHTYEVRELCGVTCPGILLKSFELTL